MNDPDPTRESPEEAIFLRALELPAAERAAFLDGACGGNAVLRARVETLLRADAAATRFLATPPAGEVAAALRQHAPAPADDLTGARVGRYKLLQRIGEGGCGVVYLAEQVEPVRRRVAVKVIKLGMDTKEIIARFEAERQALALMDHANIARVFDAGATDAGRPYFVMELVRGQPITRFCDEQHLPTRTRLELFAQVCQAVQHAHQKGVIHRDLKPSNILVTLHDGVPVPKVIDFGIAKATQGRLTDATLFTAFEQFIGTPAYMSPEQAELSGLDIDTRSDIYSLGVLLYELLTGRPPFDPQSLLSAGLDEIRRIIREVEPPRPSTRLGTLGDADRATIARQRGTGPGQLHTLLRGDLDWIVMRCLEKDRTRRYETANGLAVDIQRHLRDEPVVARPPSAAYRLRKVIVRHRVAVAAGTVVFLALVSGIVVSTWQAVRATEAERVALSERTRAELARRTAEAARANESRLRAEAEASARAAETETATTAAVLAFLQDDLLSQARPDREPDRDIKLRTVLDRAAVRIEQAFPGQPLVEAAVRATLAATYSSLGDAAASERHLTRALELRRRELGPEDPRTIAVIQSLLGAFRAQEKFQEAETLARTTLARLRESLGPENRATLAIHAALAPIVLAQGRQEETAAIHADVLAIRSRVLGRDHPETATAIHNLGYARHQQGRFPEAIALYTEALEIRRRLLGREHRETLGVLVNLGRALLSNARREEAEQCYAEALEIRQRSLGNEHPDTLDVLTSLGVVYSSQGRHTEAVAKHREATETKRRVLGAEHPDTLMAMRYLADALVSQGHLGDAATVYLQIVEARSRVLGPEHSATLEAMTKLASVYRNHRRVADAAAIYERVLAIQRRVLGPEHPKTLDAMVGLASTSRSLGKYAEAAARQAEVAAIRARVLGPEHPRTLEARSYIAWNWRSEGRNAEAAALLEEVWALQKRVVGPRGGTTLLTAGELAGALLGLAAYERAEAVLRELCAERQAARSNDWRLILDQWQLAEALVGLRRFDEASAVIRDSCATVRARPELVPSSARGQLRRAAERVVQLATTAGEGGRAAGWRQELADVGIKMATAP